jgi:large conductance mechanosensitive channel protein
MRNCVTEFRVFLLRGSLIDLAVGIVIGVAFGALVNAFVKDLITPIIAAIFGKQDSSNLSFTINGSRFLLRRLHQRADHVLVGRGSGVLSSSSSR